MGRGPAVVVRPANNLSEVKDLIQLTAESFLPEVKGSGLSIAQYVDLEVEHVGAFPQLWNHIGVCVERGTVRGAAVVRFQGDRERHMSLWEMVWRLGLLATLWSIVSNRLLVDGVREGDALIDSIAVHPDSQGRGFGSALLKWCEATVAAEAEPGTSSNLYLWVAETNAAAGMYARHGFQVVKKTRDDWSAPFMRRVLRSFLGFPDWHRMVKVVAGAKKPLPQVKPLPLRPLALPRQPVRWDKSEPASPLASAQKMVCRVSDTGRLDKTVSGEWLISAADIPLPGGTARTDEQLIEDFEQSVGVGGAQPRVPVLHFEPALAEEAETSSPAAGREPLEPSAWDEPSTTDAQGEQGPLLAPSSTTGHGQVPQGYGPSSWQPTGRAVPLASVGLAGSSLGRRRLTAEVKPTSEQR